MKKSLILVCAAALLFSSCGSNKVKGSASSKVKTVIGAEGVERPDWVLSGMEDDTGMYAVGNGKMSNKSNSLKVAETQGRAELTRMVQATVKDVVTTYVQDTGIEKDALSYLENATTQRSVGILKGSKRVDYWVDEDNTVFALMYLPYSAVVPSANEIVSEYVVDAKTKITEDKVAEALKKYKLLDSDE